MNTSSNQEMSVANSDILQTFKPIQMQMVSLAKCLDNINLWRQEVDAAHT